MPHDLLLIDGDLPERPTLVRDRDPRLIVQRIRTRLRTFRGEWLLDQRVGLPWLEWRAEKPPRPERIRDAVRELLETTPGVVRVPELSARLDRERRAVVLEGRVTIVNDEELTFSGDVLGEGNVSPAIVFHTRSGAIIL